MKKAYVFPGQGSQFVGMGLDMFQNSDLAKDIFRKADEVIGFSLSEVMFHGTEEDLKQTNITQPAIFLHSYIRAKMAGENFLPEGVAGHSLGEFTALVAANVLSFEDGLTLVHKRATAMQAACETNPGTMAAIVGLDDAIVEEICSSCANTVVAANYNCLGQLVISGSLGGVEEACKKCSDAGATRALMLTVGGAFHSPLMAPAQSSLESAIMNTSFHAPNCPVYQNVDALPNLDPESIKLNLISQLTSPVRWTQIQKNMIADGYNHFVEVGGNGTVLRGMLKRVDRNIPSEAI
jgi:[acyl-carrier-protein] S-malonyltransferase